MVNPSKPPQSTSSAAAAAAASAANPSADAFLAAMGMDSKTLKSMGLDKLDPAILQSMGLDQNTLKAMGLVDPKKAPTPASPSGKSTPISSKAADAANVDAMIKSMGLDPAALKAMGIDLTKKLDPSMMAALGLDPKVVSMDYLIFQFL